MFSEITAPLRDLVAKENEFRWNERHTDAFNRVKMMLSTVPVLHYFTPGDEITIQAESSQSGFGTVLLCNGAVVEYAARALTKSETLWAQCEKELGSILYSLERFDTSYVYGRYVKVQSDHKPLLAIHKKAVSSAPRRLQRMMLTATL